MSSRSDPKKRTESALKELVDIWRHRVGNGEIAPHEKLNPNASTRKMTAYRKAMNECYARTVDPDHLNKGKELWEDKEQRKKCGEEAHNVERALKECVDRFKKENRQLQDKRGYFLKGQRKVAEQTCLGSRSPNASPSSPSLSFSPSLSHSPSYSSTYPPSPPSQAVDPPQFTSIKKAQEYFSKSKRAGMAIIVSNTQHGTRLFEFTKGSQIGRAHV